jgi:hypothetical protein
MPYFYATTLPYWMFTFEYRQLTALYVSARMIGSTAADRGGAQKLTTNRLLTGDELGNP